VVALTSLVVFPTDLATAKNYNEKNKMKILQRNLKLFTQAIFKITINFFVNSCMRILHTKFEVYAILSSG
jgi:hypothetical protein